MVNQNNLRVKLIEIVWLISILVVISMPQLSLYAKIIAVSIMSSIYVITIEYSKALKTFMSRASFMLILSLSFILTFTLIMKLLFIGGLSALMACSVSISILFVPAISILLLARIFLNMEINCLEFLAACYVTSLVLLPILLVINEVSLKYILFTMLLFALLASSITYYKKSGLAIPIRSLKRKMFQGKNLGLFLICVNAITIIAILYPEMSFIPGYDIARHYGSALEMTISPISVRSPYPAYWLHIAAIYELSGKPSPFVLNTALSMLSLMLLVAFYMLVEKIYGTYLAAVATFLFAFGGGLGWINIIRIELMGERWTRYLWHVWRVSNADIGYGLGTWLWFWYRPVTVGTTLLFILLYSLLNDDMDGRLRSLINILIPTTLMVYHPSEAMLMIVLLASVLIFKKLSPQYIAFTTVGALIGGLLRMMFEPFAWLQSLLLSLTISITIIILWIAASKSSKLYMLITSKRAIDTRLARFSVASIILPSYMFSIYYYISTPEMYIVDTDPLPVPLYHYVVLLGVPGLLAIITILYKLLREDFNPIDKTLISIAILSFIFGRIITYVNESPLISLLLDMIGYTYFERRIVASLIYPITCIFASQTLTTIMQYVVTGETHDRTS